MRPHVAGLSAVAGPSAGGRPQLLRALLLAAHTCQSSHVLPLGIRLKLGLYLRSCPSSASDLPILPVSWFPGRTFSTTSPRILGTQGLLLGGMTKTLSFAHKGTRTHAGESPPWVTELVCGEAGTQAPPCLGLDSCPCPMLLHNEPNAASFGKGTSKGRDRLGGIGKVP